MDAMLEEKNDLIRLAEGHIRIAESLEIDGMSVYFVKKVHAYPYACDVIMHFSSAGEFYSKAGEKAMAIESYKHAIKWTRSRRYLKRQQIIEKEGLWAAFCAKYGWGGIERFVDGIKKEELERRIDLLRN